MADRHMLIQCYKNEIDNIFHNANDGGNGIGIVKIMLWNVHIWKDVDGKNTFDTILKTIEDSNCHIVCLNEALFFSNDIRNRFVDKMKSIGYTFVVMTNNYGINVVVSKIQLSGVKILCLGKDPIRRQNRYATKFSIDGIEIVLTHLDPYDETGRTRLCQIKKINASFPFADIILGDFNSLMEMDYDYDRWCEIVFLDKYRGIDTNTLVTDHLTYKEYEDAYIQINPSTVWSMRRVDYIMFSPSFTDRGYFIPFCCSIKSSASDHLPLVAHIHMQ